MEFKLPELGEDVEGGDIISIIVKRGETVQKEQTLMEIETDKAVIELPSPVDGTIKELHIEQGDNVKIGQLLVTFDSNGDQPAQTTKEEITDSKTIEQKPAEEQTNADTDIEQKVKSEETFQQLIAEDQAEKKDADTDNVISITKQETEDIDQSNIERVPASPSVRRLAREIGVDISSVAGSGPGGRISEEDVKAFAKSNLSSTDVTQIPTASKSEVKVPRKQSEPIEQMSKVRILTAQRLTESWKAPHVTQHDKADITELEKIRKQYGDQVKQAGGKLTMTSIVTKITSQALVKFPKFKCSIDIENHRIINNENYNIGIAVDTDRGLLVPVIKNANKKNITEISVELSDISERSRNKKIKVDELQGSTFTITNLGGIGGTYFTPVINFPNVAILGLSRSVMEPVYIDEEFKPRLMMPLSLSYDHRIIDGADAIRFLRWIIEALENPFLTLLDS